LDGGAIPGLGSEKLKNIQCQNQNIPKIKSGFNAPSANALRITRGKTKRPLKKRLNCPSIASSAARIRLIKKRKNGKAIRFGYDKYETVRPDFARMGT